MTRQLHSSGSRFEAEAGYSRAVRDGEFVFVAGTTGFDYSTMTIPEDLAQQVHNCFANLAAALGAMGAELRHVVRVNYILTDRAYYKVAAPIFGQYFQHIRPAATAIVAGLIDPRMKIEIEATAKLPAPGPFQGGH
jgi:enamine deaminase RidA (YjgF/YER057c/UK114 family)